MKHRCNYQLDLLIFDHFLHETSWNFILFYRVFFKHIAQNIIYFGLWRLIFNYGVNNWLCLMLEWASKLIFLSRYFRELVRSWTSCFIRTGHPLLIWLIVRVLIVKRPVSWIWIRNSISKNFLGGQWDPKNQKNRV